MFCVFCMFASAIDAGTRDGSDPDEAAAGGNGPDAQLTWVWLKSVSYGMARFVFELDQSFNVLLS